MFWAIFNPLDETCTSMHIEDFGRCNSYSQACRVCKEVVHRSLLCMEHWTLPVHAVLTLRVPSGTQLAHAGSARAKEHCPCYTQSCLPFSKPEWARLCIPQILQMRAQHPIDHLAPSKQITDKLKLLSHASPHELLLHINHDHHLEWSRRSDEHSFLSHGKGVCLMLCRQTCRPVICVFQALQPSFLLSQPCSLDCS